MTNEPDIKTKVLAKISRGELRKRPRFYFAAQIALIAVLFILAMAFAMFVASFVLFSVHESGEQFLLGFGSRGALTFLALFPWLALVVDVALFAVIGWLARSFKFGYRIPVIRAFFAILALALVSGVLINFTPLHPALLDRADHDNLPVLGEWYETVHASHRDQGVFRGTVNSIRGDAFVISHDDNDHDADDGTWTVIAPPGFSMATLAVGENVFIAGTAGQGTIRAYGVQQFP